ncbi:outer membrane protein assembly factor BamC [Vibrio plantisponsor]|jgi:outer membrane protein assembly factor BamC|uniref:Outer membrane protein assembly factor BamC n=1 Tax=Vibrio plantisponsor TaxID=664643 RepID=A0ABU4IGU8_9VIBR|nr:outer membrane protein assembly factor BamC [Vibrio plantisponsor]MDW6017778.1 outer membrane protein assembly factor BamC [Vibrio plantisponsor]NNM40611.1 outer membrane protein assembly factor BamC [Vibrio plantisponsor]PNH89286.1 outer membrane protein assembly factor BamC [Vibrio diazotrophicus]
MKFTRQLVISSLAVLVLSACSNSTHRRQAKDDFTYLETKSFSEWQLPEGATPEFYPNFEIPQGNYHGGVGQTVDIRPPQQVLELIPGARAERQKGEVSLWMVRKDEVDKVWDTVLKVIAERKINILSQTHDRIETDWVSWVAEDEDVELGARYEVTRVEDNNRYGFKVSLIDWREDGKQMPVSTTNKERYNALMTNLVTTRYDLDAREEAARKAQELVKQIPISMGADRSGLPVIIARSSYDVLWPRLPNILPHMGFTIEERSQSQGTVKAKYASPDDEFWQEIGVKPIALKSGTYTFLFGDLGNRTSINVTDSSGKPVEEALLKDMVPVLAAVIDKK